MSEAYNGHERRSDDIRKHINDFSKSIESMKTDVMEEISDMDSRLAVACCHMDTIQGQIQDSLQRQLDQNSTAHQEMIALYRHDIKQVIDSQEKNIEIIITGFMKELNSTNDNVKKIKSEMELIKADILVISNKPITEDSNKWKKIRDITISIIATAILTTGVSMYQKAILMPFSNKQEPTPATEKSGNP